MASRREVIEETNARYWVSTGYKLGEALDPNDPTDRMHAKRWLDTYRDLLHQNARGILMLLHKDPSFAQSLTDAISAYRIEHATHAGDPRYAEAQRVKHQALSDAGMWGEMIMARGGTAVSGSEDAPKAEQKARWLVPVALVATFGIAYFGYTRPMQKEAKELERKLKSGELRRGSL